jgi:hypothetical protein
MPFNNPIVGGTALVRPAINSPNYVPLTTGWSINADGTVDLGGGTFRGSLILGDPSAAGGAIYLAQTLPTSMQTEYSAAIFYKAPITGRPQVFIGIRKVGGRGTIDTGWILWDRTNPADPGKFVVVQRLSGSIQDTPFDLAEYFVGIVETSPGWSFPLASSQFSVAFEQIVANVAGTAETWHNITGGVGYAPNWADIGGTDQAGRYRLMPDGTVSLNGDAKTTVAVSTPSIVFTLPVGYRPAADEQFPGNVAGSRIAVQASTGRVILVDVAGTVAIPVLALSQVRFPLPGLA